MLKIYYLCNGSRGGLRGGLREGLWGEVLVD